MARIERASPEIKAPVKQAVLIDPNAFRFEGAGEGLKEIGLTISEIGKRKVASQDSLAISKVNNSQQLTEAKMRDFMVRNPDPSKWEAEIERLATEQAKEATGLDVSAATQDKIKVSQDAFQQLFKNEFRIQQAQTIIKADIDVTGADLIGAIADNDGSVIGQQAEDLAREAHEDALLRGEAPEVAAIQFKETLTEGKKAFYENRSKLNVDVATALIEEMNTKKKKLGTKGEDADGLNAKDFDDIINSAKTFISRETATVKHNNDAAIEAEKQTLDDVFIQLQDEFLQSVTQAMDKINTSEILTVKDKEQQRAKINKRLDAIKAGKVDPVDEFDPEAYERLAIKISRNSKSVKSTDISGLVGNGDINGLTIRQAEELTKLKKFYDGADVIGNSLHSTYTAAMTGLKTAKAFSKNKVENTRLAAQARSALDSWAVKNPDATEEDYRNFFERLIDNSRMNTWGRGWFTRESEENRIAVRENLAEIQQELTEGTRKFKKGDTREVDGVIWTFDGKVWSN